MNQLFETINGFFQKHALLVYPLFTSIMATLATYIYYLGYKRLRPQLTKNGHFIISALLKAIHWPVVAFIWLQATSHSIKAFSLEMDKELLYWADKLHDVGLILLLGWTFMRFTQRFEEELLAGHLSKKHLDETSVNAIGKLLRVASMVLIILFTLPMVGIEVSGIVAFGGGSAIVLGIGAQQIFANYFGGLVIYADRHFNVGDWISSPEKEIKGRVEQIGWRTTQIRTPDRKLLYVPNAAFASITVINSTRMTNRCIKETIEIRHEDAALLNSITKEIRTMLKNHPGIDQKKLQLAHLVDLGHFSLKIDMLAFTKTTERAIYQDVKQHVLLETLNIIKKHEAALVNLRAAYGDSL